MIHIFKSNTGDYTFSAYNVRAQNLNGYPQGIFQKEAPKLTLIFEPQILPQTPFFLNGAPVQPLAPAFIQFLVFDADKLVGTGMAAATAQLNSYVLGCPLLVDVIFHTKPPSLNPFPTNY